MQPIRVASKPTITTRVYDSASRIISRPGRVKRRNKLSSADEYLSIYIILISLITYTLESSIINKDSNMTQSIMRKIINVQQDKSRTKHKALKNIAINRPFLRCIPIHMQTVLYINEKWRTNAEKLIRKFMRLKLVKKISMPNPIKIVVISSDIIGVVWGVLKASAILSATTFKRSTVEPEDLKPCWKSENQKGIISQGDEQVYYLQTSQIFYLKQAED